VITTASGLQYVEVEVGTGETAAAGVVVRVHYTGRLADGTTFDSSLDRNDPIVFTLGVGQVIQGWDEGLTGMKVGGKRTLIIPAILAYGSRGAGGVIPPNAELTFEVELVGIGRA
jgi:peptidylprolyl isomerase